MFLAAEFFKFRLTSFSPGHLPRAIAVHVILYFLKSFTITLWSVIAFLAVYYLFNLLLVRISHFLIAFTLLDELNARLQLQCFYVEFVTFQCYRVDITDGYLNGDVICLQLAEERDIYIIFGRDIS